MENSTDFLSLLTEAQQNFIKENLEEYRKIKETLLESQQQSLSDDTYRKLTDEDEIRVNLLYSKYNKDIHEAFVKYCLNPKGYETNNGEVFASIVGVESINETNHVNISVVTPLMAYIDNRYFVSGNKNDNVDNIWWNDYRPYYYEFTANLSNDEFLLFKEKIKKLKEKSEFDNKGPFWFKAKLKNISKDNPGKFIGILNFCGSSSHSDILEITSFMPIDKELRKLLNDPYHLKIRANKNNCIKYLNQYFSPVTQFRINVYNVGQANCIYIEDKNSTKRFFFDYGKPNDAYINRKQHLKIINPDVQPNTNVSINLERIRLLPRDLIIVSHWHSDHFVAFEDLYDYGVNSVWILPRIDIKYDIKSAARLLNYLVLKHAEVYYLNSNGKLFDKNGIQLLSSSASRRSDPNTRSLMLRIKDTVFSADCLYEFWPDELKNNLSDVIRLVVPHHCSQEYKNKKGISESHRIINSFSKTPDKEAYISVGFNTYGHPNGPHKTLLKNAGFAINETSSTTDGYTFVIN